MDIKAGEVITIESRALPNGKGGIFINGELVDELPSEAESDAAAKRMVRMMIVAGDAKQAGQAYENDQPIGLWDELLS
jgi:hypothetical protein